MRGNVVMKGYLKNQQATQAAFKGGWFHTGDLGVMHGDGYIELKDRSKDIIISGGENISTIEVEGVLFRHPAVLEAAVVAKSELALADSAINCLSSSIWRCRNAFTRSIVDIALASFFSDPPYFSSYIIQH